jgi:integrase
MKVLQAKDCFLDYQRMNAKKNTMRNYQSLFSRFCSQFGDREIESLTIDEILSFLKDFTEGTKQSTKKLRFSLLSAFFNFIRNSIDPNFQNPCNSPILKKLFKHAKTNNWKILEKDVVDEFIFRTENSRDRLMLELMARGGMRVSEVLKITPDDVDDRKIVIRDPKSGKKLEVVFLPQKVAERLKEYIRNNDIEPDKRIFPISYPAARMAVKKAGKLVGINLNPHDLRRFAATYASRSGTPLEIISKIILRHTNLQTTQLYLGKISDLEAMRWIDNLHN